MQEHSIPLISGRINNQLFKAKLYRSLTDVMDFKIN